MSSSNNNNSNKQTIENNPNIMMYELDHTNLLKDQQKKEDNNNTTTTQGQTQATLWERFKSIDPSKVPCLKNSLLFGIGAGVGVTFISTIFSKKPIKAADLGVLTFVVVSGVSWPICNYNRNIQEQKIKIVMDAQMAELNRKSKLLEEEKEKLKKVNEDSKKE
eukprot:gene2813-3498_t